MRVGKGYWLLAVTALLWLLGLMPGAALAHPLDEFYQVTYLILNADRVTLKIELYPGVLVAPRLLPLLDSNQDDTLSQAEMEAYVDGFISDLTLTVDDEPLPLTVENLDFPPALAVRAGQAVIRFDLHAVPPSIPGGHALFYRNNHMPDSGVYVINAMTEIPAVVQITDRQRDIQQSSIHMAYQIKTAFDEPAPAQPGPGADIEKAGTVSAGQEYLNSFLYNPELSPLLAALALGLSVLLGGIHALTPGHGKTLVAAYLIGSRGTIKDAVTLGGIVTFTHTASVVVIGLLALLASQFIVPNLFVPLLEAASGALVLYLGLRLLWTRWRDYRHNAEHHHHHHHGDDHAHHHHHDHDLPESVRLSDLLTLGISGGMVPCPEALGIMLIAIGLNRILLGLGLIVAFSFGLAAVLIAIGILLVRSKRLLDGFGQAESRWQTLLPLVSAVVVTLLGVGIMVKGLLPWLGD
jgi:nickel/cobalt exporter